jgi:PAS domain S-box-containing protein
MQPAPLPPNEAQRLAALQSYRVVGSCPDQALDDLAELAAQICNTPIATVSIVAELTQWFKARVGLEMCETAREISFCAHALRQKDLFIVPDAMLDTRFVDNPLVTGAPKIRFYAGAPLVTPEGPVLGTLAVADRVPRQLTPAQERALRVLSRQVMTHLELHRQERELRAKERKLRAIFEAEPQCVKLLSAEAELLEINPAGLRLIEADKTSAVVGDCLLPLVVPDDRAGVSETLAAVAKGERRTIQFRITSLKGTARSIEMSAVPFQDESGGPTSVLGVSYDITARQHAEAKIQRLNRIHAVSSSVNEVIVRIRDSVELYEQACRIAVEKGGMAMAWVGLVEPDGQVLHPIAQWGRDEGYLDAIEVRTTAEGREGRGPAGRAFRAGAPVCCNDIEADDETFASRNEALKRGFRSCAAFPIRSDRQTIGVLVVYGNQPNFFDDEELKLLNALAENISYAVDSHRK